MDHQEAHELLPAYLDKELDIPANIALERHLGNCPDCQREYAQQSAMSARVRKEAEYFSVPAHLEKRLDATLPQVPAPVPVDSSRTKYWNPYWINAFAAMLTLTVLAWSVGLYLRLPSASERLAEEVVASHVRSLQVDHLSDIASSDQHTVKPWFNGKLDFSPPVVDLAPQGFPLEGGRLDYLGGRQVAALIYRHNRHPINLYVSPATDKDTTLQVQYRQGYHLLHWTLHGMEYWAVSDLASNDLTIFAQFFRSAVPH